MNNMASPRYIVAPALSVSSRRDDTCVMANIITGQMFEFSADAYNVISRINSPHTVEEILAEMPEIAPEELRRYLEHLMDLEVLVDADDDAPGGIYQLAQKSIRLFDAPQFDERTTEPHLVVAGIPFGRGNALPNFTANAPQVLRNFTNALQVDTRVIQASTCLSGIFGINLDMTRLQETVRNGRLRDWGDLYIHEHEPVQNIYHRIGLMATDLFAHGHRPVFLGGDHSISLPIIRACSEQTGNLHVIHIDAHTDMYEHRIDQLYNIKVHHHGNFARRSLELPGVDAVYQFGIRGLNNIGESAAGPKHHMYFMEPTLEIASGMRSIELPDGVPYYVTVDIDVLDSSIAPATNSPVPGGLTYRELLSLLARLMRGRNIVGVDLVEIDPEKDIGHRTIRLGIELLLVLISFLHPDPDHHAS